MSRRFNVHTQSLLVALIGNIPDCFDTDSDSGEDKGAKLVPAVKHDNDDDLFAIEKQSDSSSSDSDSSSSSSSSIKITKVCGARGRATDDRSHLVPAGCSLKKYEPSGKPAYWHGILRAGVVDDKGSSNRQRRWGGLTKLTEDEVIERIVDWAFAHCG